MMSTSDKILKAAKKLFSENGYSETSTRKIAKEAQVNEVTIFRIFGTKSKLLQSLIANFAYEGNIIEKIDKEITGNIREDLYIFAHVYYQFLENNINLYKIQIKEIGEKGETFSNSVAYVQYMKDYLEKEKTKNNFKGDPQMVASTLVTLIFGIFSFDVYNSTVYTQNVKPKTIMDQFVDHIYSLYC